MSETRFRESPYYNDFDPAKQFTQIMFRPGRVGQSREFTQLQDYWRYALKNIADTQLRNGAVIEGCQLVVNSKSVTLSPGKVYIDGMVRTVHEQTLTITGVGVETIGVRVLQTIITEEQDSSLRDPAQGFQNFNQPGADRIKETILAAVNDPGSVILYQLRDGEIVAAEEQTSSDFIIDLLARRTYDQSGNYKIFGLDAFNSEKIEPTGRNVYINVDSGRAYIRGYEHNKVSPTLVLVRKSTNVRDIRNELKVFVDGVSRYQLYYDYAKQVTDLAVLLFESLQINRSSLGSIDYFPGQYLVEYIVQVTQGPTTFIPGTDYMLVSNGIEWVSPNRPSSGTTYVVDFHHRASLVPDVDFSLTIEDEGRSYINFIDAMKIPVNGSSMIMSYVIYLARRDFLAMDKNGSFTIVEGAPDILRLARLPVFSDTFALELAQLTVYPNSTRIDITNTAVRSMSMEDLWRLLRRIANSEHNTAVQDLDRQATEGRTPTELRGILTDGFIGLTKADYNHPDFSAALDLPNGELTLRNRSDVRTLEVDSTNPLYSASISGRLITAPMQEIISVDQKLASQIMLINPYAAFNSLGAILLDPASDTWIDTRFIDIDGGTNVVYNTVWDMFSWEGVVASSSSSRVSTTTVLDEAQTFMRQIDIDLTAENFMPMSDNLVLAIDGIVITALGDSVVYRGTEPGTLKSDSQGIVKGSFRIPEGIRTGVREVSLSNANNYGVATFTAQGRLQVIQRTVSITQVLTENRISQPIREESPVESVDPLAQTFSFATDTMLSAIGLYFAAKDNINNIQVQVRNVVNGYPGPVVWAEEIINPQNVNTSADSSVETIAHLNSPVYCQGGVEYCFVVMTNSSTDSLYIAELGKRDILTQNYISQQPFSVGLMFSSSNASAWTAHQTMDVKFRLYAHTYLREGIVPFHAIEADIDNLVIAADMVAPEGTSVNFEYLDTVGNNWLPISPFEMRQLTRVTQSLSVRAVMRPVANISPIITAKSNLFVGLSRELTGVYYTRTVDLREGYNTVDQVAEIAAPPGTDVQIQYSFDEGESWHTTAFASSQYVDDEFIKYSFRDELGLSHTSFKARIILLSNNRLARPRVRRFMNIMTTI